MERKQKISEEERKNNAFKSLILNEIKLLRITDNMREETVKLKAKEEIRLKIESKLEQLKQLGSNSKLTDQFEELLERYDDIFVDAYNVELEKQKDKTSKESSKNFVEKVADLNSRAVQDKRNAQAVLSSKIEEIQTNMKREREEFYQQIKYDPSKSNNHKKEVNGKNNLESRNIFIPNTSSYGIMWYYGKI